MIELLFLYRWTIPAGACFAAALALLGIQLSARDRSLQSFCVSQGSMVGILLGLGAGISPAAMGLLAAIFVFFGSEKAVGKLDHSRNTIFGAIYIILLAMSYMASVAFPALESHMAGIFFGDLATLGMSQSLRILPVSLIALAILILFWRPISSQSFDIALFGERTATTLSANRWRALLLGVSLITLSVSVQFLGFLFTVAFLYLPTVILGMARPQGLIRHMILCGSTAAISVIVGFFGSLFFPQLPTVPTIIFTYVAAAILLQFQTNPRSQIPRQR